MKKYVISFIGVVMAVLALWCNASPSFGQSNLGGARQNEWTRLAQVAESAAWKGALRSGEAQTNDDAPWTLPQDSSVFSAELANRTLALSSANTAEAQAQQLESAGFTVRLQQNYDKADTSPEHTSAYTVATQVITFAGAERTLAIVVVRGTNGGEWYSNFDFAPSKSNQAVFAENFLFAAENVFLGAKTVLDGISNPLIVACGHSRGGATANLLGMLLNEQYGTENVYVYTSATPATFRGDGSALKTSNIFNLVNDGDVVPLVPLAAWGFVRLGTDVVLHAAEEDITRAAYVGQTLAGISADISSYYRDRHSLEHAGLSEDGITAFEMMLCLANTMLEGESAATTGAFDVFSEESDFAPLFAMISKAAENNGTLAIQVLIQHLPMTYQTLLNQKENG